MYAHNCCFCIYNGYVSHGCKLCGDITTVTIASAITMWQANKHSSLAALMYAEVQYTHTHTHTYILYMRISAFINKSLADDM